MTSPPAALDPSSPLVELARILALGGGYNTTVVMIGVALLGLAGGIVGTFAILRKRAMMSDTMSHATLPGIALAFLLAVAFGWDARTLPVLLAGAAATGIVGVLVVHVISNNTRLPEDAAMGAVLSVFFGAGFVLLSYIQTLGTGSEGGLNKFIYGQTAAMSASEAWTIGAVAVFAIVAAFAFFKEFRLVSFDPDFASVQGWPVPTIDLLMMALVVVVTVVGLKAVGLILVVALIVIPAAAARFWTERLSTMLVIAGAFGALSGYLGAALSALLPRFPAGGVIVLVAGTLFIVSLFLAPRRGVLSGALRQLRLAVEIESQHILRHMFEMIEATGRPLATPIPMQEVRQLLAMDGLRRFAILGRLSLMGLIERHGEALALTPQGAAEAARITRNHRLWERYLISHAHLAPSHVHRSADLVEHVLDREIVQRLEAELAAAGRLPRLEGVPESVHPYGEPDHEPKVNLHVS